MNIGGRNVSLTEYWRSVRAIQKELEQANPGGLVHLTSKAKIGGAVIETDSEMAAKLILNESHRVSTDEEIDAARVTSARATDAAITDRLAKLGMVAVALPSRPPPARGAK